MLLATLSLFGNLPNINVRGTVYFTNNVQTQVAQLFPVDVRVYNIRGQVVWRHQTQTDLNGEYLVSERQTFAFNSYYTGRIILREFYLHLL